MLEVKDYQTFVISFGCTKECVAAVERTNKMKRNTKGYWKDHQGEGQEAIGTAAVRIC